MGKGEEVGNAPTPPPLVPLGRSVGDIDAHTVVVRLAISRGEDVGTADMVGLEVAVEVGECGKGVGVGNSTLTLGASEVEGEVDGVAKALRDAERVLVTRPVLVVEGDPLNDTLGVSDPALELEGPKRVGVGRVDPEKMVTLGRPVGVYDGLVVAVPPNLGEDVEPLPNEGVPERHQRGEGVEEGEVADDAENTLLRLPLAESMPLLLAKLVGEVVRVPKWGEEDTVGDPEVVKVGKRGVLDAESEGVYVSITAEAEANRVGDSVSVEVTQRVIVASSEPRGLDEAGMDFVPARGRLGVEVLLPHALMLGLLVAPTPKDGVGLKSGVNVAATVRVVKKGGDAVAAIEPDGVPV